MAFGKALAKEGKSNNIKVIAYYIFTSIQICVAEVGMTNNFTFND